MEVQLELGNFGKEREFSNRFMGRGFSDDYLGEGMSDLGKVILARVALINKKLVISC